MTPQNIKDNTESVVEETWSDEEYLVRLNRVNRRIVKPELGLEEYKQAFTTSTTAQSLPTATSMVKRVMSSDGVIEYSRIRFDQQSTLSLYPYSYYINEASGTITFSNSGASVNVFYTLQPTELTMSSTFPIPSQYHDLYLYGIIVDYFIGEDADDVNIAKANFWQGRFTELYNSFLTYDATQKCDAEGYAIKASDDYLISNGLIP